METLNQANQRDFVSYTQALTGTAILFAHPRLVVRLPQPLSAGVAAQTLLTYVFLLLFQHLQCTVRSLGESHLESLAQISILGGQSNTPPTSLFASSYSLLP